MTLFSAENTVLHKCYSIYLERSAKVFDIHITYMMSAIIPAIEHVSLLNKVKNITTKFVDAFTSTNQLIT